jgi:transcriptional regulator with XRE-family HTH domain
MSSRTTPFNIGPTGRLVAENIRTLRTLRKLSRRALAEKCTSHPVLTEQAIYGIERGYRRIDVDDLIVIADALRVDIITLLTKLSDCMTCHGVPQAGFTCNDCGVSA